MEYDATTTRIFDIPPYTFFSVLGVVFSSSLFILLLLKYGYSISRYTKIYFFSGVGLLIGAKAFGLLSGLYGALANKEPINWDIFINTGIVFYGGLIGFLAAFFLICKIWNKNINLGVIDIVFVCIPLFHSFGRLGCFFAGCCFGIESKSALDILYTTHTENGISTSSRLPVQLFEASLNMIIFIILLSFLLTDRFKGHLMVVYFCIYPIIRIILEFYRDDSYRGVLYGISFSQAVSLIILLCCILCMVKESRRIKSST